MLSRLSGLSTLKREHARLATRGSATLRMSWAAIALLSRDRKPMGAWIRTMAVITFVGLSQISFCTAPMFTSGSTFAPFNTGPNRLSNWGGYIAAGSTGEFNSISAEWTVPIVKCLADGNLYAPWVGIDGYGSTTVEQTGVQTDCKTGSPVDSAWYEMYPARPVYYANPVSTGDSIVASVIYSGKSFVLTITDTTKGWTRTVDKTARRGIAA